MKDPLFKFWITHYVFCMTVWRFQWHITGGSKREGGGGSDILPLRNSQIAICFLRRTGKKPPPLPKEE